MAMSVCETTEQLELRVKKIAVLASVLSRKARDLDDKLKNSNEVYNPFTQKSLGKLTEELQKINELGQDIGQLACYI